jgi:mono/diheme cytochrome c family protein
MTQAPRSMTRQCKSCHGANGLGVPPCTRRSAIIRQSTWNSRSILIRMVLFGGFPPATRGNPRPFGMPPFAYTLADQKVAEVVTYMRQSWGNWRTAVHAAEVAKCRRVPVD